MAFKMAEEAQVITVYNLRADTNEFIGKGDAYIPPHTGLPANCTDVEPPETSGGKIPVFNVSKNTWTLVEDHRGETVYNMDTGEAIHILELGPLPYNVTAISPDGEYQKWDGKQWVVDTDAKKAAEVKEAEALKSQLLLSATETIAPLQDAVDLDIATEQERQKLTVWKKYRVLLNRVDTSQASNIEWPDQPE